MSTIPEYDPLKTRPMPLNVHDVLMFLASQAHGAEEAKPSGDEPLYADVPKPRLKKSERKPYPTPMKVLIARAKEEREARKAQPCRVLRDPPDNGLLVPELVEVANRVYQARCSLLFGLSKLGQLIPPLRCRHCSEVHVGHVGHEIRTCSGPKSGFRSATHFWRKGGVQDLIFFPKSFHLYDRVGKPRIVHDERYSTPRIPAIVELCIQAGLHLEKYPTKRRTKPVYSIEGRIVDFESVTEKDGLGRNLHSENVDAVVESNLGTKNELMKKVSIPENATIHQDQSNDEGKNLRELSIRTLDSWFEMISGAKKMMEKYNVMTCGYCPEVQVGPKGHKVRMCKASKHQSRDGLHAWQEATMDDLVGPKYVWHVRDLNGPALGNNLKRYYGKAPAVVELCVQAGAPVPDQYRSMMRLDVVPPERDEVDLVA
ncbi:APO protein 3, mitochondrial [Morella rubra]|uniref:APO protein 3, mitochondrial n=1 Tax=Morella rubra TaxID=262757 RepID=A0A6A1VZP7_9ROSI|nr:APO protein 3, mitochondrial [Morella rubra]